MYVLENTAPGSEQTALAQAVIGRQTGQLSRLVDDLLDVTRISRNKIQLQRQRIDLVQLARSSAADHRASFEAQGVRLEVLSPGSPVWAFADPQRVTQMVDNLLINAGKFTDPGGRVTLEIHGQGPDLAAVSVSDTGIGMDADMVGRLFQPFEQADRSLDRTRGGLGLGLALARGLAELHGGGLAAGSPGLGQGSRFVLTLPAAAPEVPVAAPAQAAPAQPHRILVIEDNPDAALTLRLLLELSGHEVILARTGGEGLAKVKTHRPEVVFCDIGLPDLDGYSVARALRGDPECRPSCLVAMTGYGRDEDKQRALAAGFDRHFTKPADPGELQRLLALLPA
jgi:CheY-like chemotaxis protein